MSLTRDIFIRRVGAEGPQPNAAPVKANETIYRGSIATTRAGYLVAATSPASTDFVMGIIQQVTGAGPAETGPGIVGGTTDGAVWIDCATGAFLLKNGTGSDEFTAADAGKPAYVVDEETAGKTTGGGTRPLLGTALPADPTTPTGYWPFRLTTPAQGL